MTQKRKRDEEDASALLAVFDAACLAVSELYPYHADRCVHAMCLPGSSEDEPAASKKHSKEKKPKKKVSSAAPRLRPSPGLLACTPRIASCPAPSLHTERLQTTTTAIAASVQVSTQHMLLLCEHMTRMRTRMASLRQDKDKSKRKDKDKDKKKDEKLTDAQRQLLRQASP